MRILIILVATLTLLLGLLMAFGGPISQTGLFDWRMAFTIMQKGAMPLMIGGGLSLLGLIIGVVGKHRGTVFTLTSHRKLSRKNAVLFLILLWML